MNVAIIPARAGSKSIVNKNLQKLGHSSLIEHAVFLALESQIFSKIIVTTDIDTVIEDYRDDRRIDVIRRPEKFATDEALMSDTIYDTVTQLQLDGDDYFWLLQPTSPFRKVHDVKEIAKLLETSPASVMSVSYVGASHPERMYLVKRGQLWPFSGKYTNFKNKQDLDKEVYIRNGCFYVCKVSEFKKHRDKKDEIIKNPQPFSPRPCRPYVMEQGINIDSEEDLALARLRWE